MSDPSPDRYRLNLPPAVADRLRVDRRWAWAAGFRDELAAALREIDFRLTVEPLEWGESRERLESLELDMRCGTSGMVTVLYGVNVRNQFVVVKEFRLNRRYRPRPDG